VKRPIDILCGTDRIRLALDEGTSPRKLAADWKADVARFKARRKPYLLY
jgi:uncharacterized protein YbbC (DUF1343 family)